MSNNIGKSNSKDFGIIAFIPMVVFLVIYIGGGMIYSSLGFNNPYGVIPIAVPLIIGVVVGMFMGKFKGGTRLDDQIDVFMVSAGAPGVVSMMIIYVLAGAFAGSAEAMGGVESVVNFGLTYIPSKFIVSGIFIIASFISLAMGTSMGTIAAIAPIAVGFAESAGISPAIALGALVGGAMFGDNLSIISDTTIAACQGVGCNNKDKFRMNFFIALPAAILTIIIFAFKGGGGAVVGGSYPYELIKIVPYLIVLISAVLGMNVFAVLLSGILLSGIVGLATATFTITGFVESIGIGIGGMSMLLVNTLLITGMAGQIKAMGGIKWALNFFEQRIGTKRGAEYSVSALSAGLTFMLGNNTLAIIIGSPLAKTIGAKYDISKRRLASLLDIFACTVQGLTLHGGQLLIAGMFAGLSPLELLPYSYYQILLGIGGIVTIQFLKTKSASELGEHYDVLVDGETVQVE